MARDKWQHRERALELIKSGYPNNRESLPYLLDYLSDMNWPGSGEVLDYLIPLGEPILEHVVDVLQGEDRYWQFNIIEYLLDELPLDLIKKGIKDPIDAVQVQAIRSIESLPTDEKTTQFIKEILHTPTSERLKVELLQVLSGLDRINVVDSVIPLLDDSSSWVRLESVEYLKNQGDHSVISELEQLLSSGDDELI